MNAATQQRRSGLLWNPGWPVLAATWAVIAVLVVATNLWDNEGAQRDAEATV